jgi:hypothetical protein
MQVYGLTQENSSQKSEPTVIKYERVNGIRHKIQTEEFPEFFVEIDRRFIGRFVFCMRGDKLVCRIGRDVKAVIKSSETYAQQLWPVRQNFTFANDASDDCLNNRGFPG